MKKLLITIALLAFATSAMAATIDSDGTTFSDGSTFKTSTLVTMAVLSNGTDYHAGTKHENGTKAYLGTNKDPEIFEDTACSKGEVISGVPALSGDLDSDSVATCATPSS